VAFVRITKLDGIYRMLTIQLLFQLVMYPDSLQHLIILAHLNGYKFLVALDAPQFQEFQLTIMKSRLQVILIFHHYLVLK